MLEDTREGTFFSDLPHPKFLSLKRRQKSMKCRLGCFFSPLKMFEPDSFFMGTWGMTACETLSVLSLVHVCGFS